MSEIDELIKGVPEFWSMPPDQLVPHAYAMFALISKLDSENTELREQGARLFDKTLEIGTENAKLRELARDMWTYITEPVSKRNGLKERLARLDDIGDRMDELRVES